MTAWLSIIGVGEGSLPVIPPAEVVIGPKRVIERLRQQHPDRAAELVEWRSLKIDEMVAQITGLRGTPTVLLASGDPLWFGIGATLARHLSPAEFRVEPHISSFQHAAARQRWPLQHVVTLSAHARPVEVIHPHIAPGNRILALTTDATIASRVAALLAGQGYGRSILTALENLGGPDERIASAEARSFDLTIGDFYVLAIDCVADLDAPLFPAVPGLPDTAFVNDGQLTKRDVRASAIARLAPYPGALLWDIGAGCGSVAIEWMRAARDARSIAFEKQTTRVAMIETNARALGVPSLAVVVGEAPGALAGQPIPDAVFIGGGIARGEVFAAAWAALRTGGRLVANAVTLDAEAALFAHQKELGGELIRIEVSTLDTLGSSRTLRPKLPVTQWAVVKP